MLPEHPDLQLKLTKSRLSHSWDINLEIQHQLRCTTDHSVTAIGCKIHRQKCATQRSSPVESEVWYKFKIHRTLAPSICFRTIYRAWYWTSHIFYLPIHPCLPTVSPSWHFFKRKRFTLNSPVLYLTSSTESGPQFVQFQTERNVTKKLFIKETHVFR